MASSSRVTGPTSGTRIPDFSPPRLPIKYLLVFAKCLLVEAYSRTDLFRIASFSPRDDFIKDALGLIPKGWQDSLSGFDALSHLQNIGGQSLKEYRESANLLSSKEDGILYAVGWAFHSVQPRNQ